MLSNLIIAAIPHTEPWRSMTALLMIICNLLAIAITFGLTKLRKRFGGDRHDDRLSSVRDFGYSELIAAMSFGHIIGVGLVLGLTNIGII
ncbi:photosystem I reaction center subunit PsaK [Chamaesiphon sp. VAR_69_metabat_338]|uniref:photosystem I reaction center subunit PsaK n=1 Tax=Chamaesiphon sp. VAR_69_metabat_338 TaxID=2964704 RepID=UPI00286E5EBB|nr:photosystem I reaction center subunit PsaK [Chamaesiphon sp. VAR_69_metabat_338]